MIRLVMQQSFRLDVRPTAKGRPRAHVVNGRPIMHTADATRDAETAIRALLIAAGAVKYAKGVPVTLRVTFGVPRPQDAPRREHYPPRRPDLPNYVMLICDAGTGVLWDDDAQLVSIEAVKENMDRPAIIVAVGVPMDPAVPVHIQMAWERAVRLMPGYQ